MASISRGTWTGVAGLLLVASLVAPIPVALADTGLPDGRYVAFGDSYSSGKGVEPYEGFNSEPDPCYRSFGAYPRLLVDDLEVTGFGFWACSGAHISHLSTRSVSTTQPPYDDPAQVPPGSRYQSALDRLGPDVSLVTITIGGHDAGFGDVMFECVQPFWLGSCDELDAEVQEDLSRLPSRLAALYRSIRSRVHPEARVLVLGYPQLFPDNPGGVCVDGGFINSDERRWLNGVATQLNAAIENSVATANGVEFVSMRDAFRTHEICGSNDSYLVGASLQHPSNSFHPNHKGHRAMATAVMNHLESVPSPVEPPPPPPPPAPPPQAPVGDAVGGFDPGTGLWALQRSDGSADTFFYGIPGDVPLMGDWNCDGIQTVAMYRPSRGFVYLRNSNSFGVADQDFYYGIPGDMPVAGDWDRDGCDTLAIFRPSQGRVYVSNTLGTAAADYWFLFGGAGDRPFAGDFNGDGADSIGFHTASGSVLYRHYLAPGTNQLGAYYGNLDHRFVTGDWDGNGDDTPGVLLPDGTIRLWNDWNFGTSDRTEAIPTRFQLPVAGVFE